MKSKGEQKKGRGFVGCLMLMLVLFCLLGGIFFYGNYLLSETERTFGPPGSGLSLLRRAQYALTLNMARDDLLLPGNTTAETRLTIKQGEEIGSIADKLNALGLVRDPSAFKSYLVYSGFDRMIKSGDFRIPAGLNALELSRVLQDSTMKIIAVNVLPGLRMEQVAETLIASGAKFTLEEFKTACQTPLAALSPLLGIEPPSCEGFLFPTYYEFDRKDGAGTMIQLMTQQFALALPRNFKDNCNAQGLNGYQCVVLASMIEKEAVVGGEQGQIASVFHNRLRQGMRLESDPTTQYALGEVAPGVWWKNPLTAEDLTANSPFNTYVISGLPPSPIASPSSAALAAAIQPTATDFYYFRAKCDNSGQHNFSRTYEEHVGFGCR